MKLKSIASALCLVMLLAPAIAIGGSVEGTVQGFTCVTQGKVCPVGKEDPMTGAERVFVLHQKGDEYYFVTNVDRGIMARHLNQRMKVEGSLSSRFKAIKADEIYIMEEGKWKKTWSQDWQDEIYRDITAGFPLTGS